MLGASLDNPLEFTLGFWALVCFAFVVVVLIPSIVIGVLAIKRRRALQLLAKEITDIWIRHDKELPEHRAVEQPETYEHLRDHYTKTQEQLEKLGFTLLWDFIACEPEPRPSFTRVMISQDGAFIASYFYDRDEPDDEDNTPYELTLHLGSWLKDGRVVFTRNTRGGLPYVDVPGVDRVDYPPDTPIEQLLDKHTKRLTGLLEQEHAAIFPVRTIKDFSQGRQVFWELCARHHLYKRTLEKILAQTFATETEAAETEADLHEMRAITQACYRELRRNY
ncbi:MAG: hypothetical protein AAF085_08435 [Planctomycetota bacterium]